MLVTNWQANSCSSSLFQLRLFIYLSIYLFGCISKLADTLFIIELIIIIVTVDIISIIILIINSFLTY